MILVAELYNINPVFLFPEEKNQNKTLREKKLGITLKQTLLTVKVSKYQIHIKPTVNKKLC